MATHIKDEELIKLLDEYMTAKNQRLGGQSFYDVSQWKLKLQGGLIMGLRSSNPNQWEEDGYIPATPLTISFQHPSSYNARRGLLPSPTFSPNDFDHEMKECGINVIPKNESELSYDLGDDYHYRVSTLEFADREKAFEQLEAKLKMISNQTNQNTDIQSDDVEAHPVKDSEPSRLPKDYRPKDAASIAALGTGNTSEAGIIR